MICMKEYHLSNLNNKSKPGETECKHIFTIHLVDRNKNVYYMSFSQFMFICFWLEAITYKNDAKFTIWSKTSSL